MLRIMIPIAYDAVKWIGIVDEVCTSGLDVGDLGLGREADSVVSATPNVTIMTESTCMTVYLNLMSDYSANRR